MSSIGRLPSEIIIGIDDAPPVPLQMGTPEEGNFCGFEVDLVDEIASRLDLAIRYRIALWSVIVEELESGMIDAICSAATVTEDRAKVVDFCTPHLTLNLAAVARADVVAEKLDLATWRVGLRRGTTAERFAMANGVTRPVMLSESNVDLYDALAAGKIDVMVDDSPIARHFSSAVPGLRYAKDFPDTDGAYAIMVQKGNDTLRAAINGVLADMENDGSLKRLRQKWLNGGHQKV